MKKGNKNVMSMILGDSDNFLIEHRIFNAAMLITIVYFLINAVTQFFIDVNTFLTIAHFLVIPIFIVIYYISRTFGNWKFLFWPYLILVMFFYIFSWIYGGGIDSPTIVMSYMLVTTLLFIVKGYERLYVTLFIYLIQISLYVFEYNYPNTISLYGSRQMQFIDNIVYITITLPIMALIIHIVMNSFFRFNENLIKEKNDIKIFYKNIIKKKDNNIKIMSVTIKKISNTLELLKENSNTNNLTEIKTNIDEIQKLLDSNNIENVIID